MSIASEISRLQTAKADLKTAIEGKGVTVPSSTKLDGYADLVDSIETGGDSGSGEMNCVYKEITGTGIRFGLAPFGVTAPIKDNLVVVHAKNTSTSYSYNLQISQNEEDGGVWYYQFTIPASGDVLILCDPNTETATLYSKSSQTSTISYMPVSGGGGAND